LNLSPTKISYELLIFVSEAQKDIVAHILGQLEIHDFIYGSLSCDIEAEYDPSCPSPSHYEQLAKDEPIVIYSEDQEYLLSLQEALVFLFPKASLSVDENTFLVRPMENQNWRDSWKESFRPILIDEEIVVYPPWESPSSFLQKHKIVIDPGMAFGTGQHETTRLCLEYIARHDMPARVIDVGTGSGILAIAALKRGASFVMGTDLDGECIPIAIENARQNHCDPIVFRQGFLEHMEETSFDLVIANIQSKPLRGMLPTLKSKLAPQGILVLSGILEVEKEEFCQWMNSCGLYVTQTNKQNHWCSIVATHQP